MNRLLPFALALVAATMFFTACGDDDSSSGYVHKNDTSASCGVDDENCECEDDDCDVSSSSTPRNDKLSSSTPRNDKLSSSTSRNDKLSSSTSRNDGNSSSSKNVESSSSKEGAKESSSSVVLSSSAKSSSSSSKKVQSSSSYDRTHAFSGFLWRDSAYKTFVDNRDGREYYYMTYVGEDSSGKYRTRNVMVENLNVGEMVPGTGDQSDDTKIERYCYDNDTLKCMEYGGLYQWAEMMQLPSRCNTESCADLIQPNHQGICPDGWRLLTYNDFHIVVYSKGNPDGVKGVRSAGFGGNNDSGYSLVAAGYNWDYVFKNIKNATYWHYPEEHDTDKYRDNSSRSGSQISSDKGMGTGRTLKTQGFSVRCVMVQ